MPNQFWTIGSGLALPLFEGGLRRAVLARFKSSYDEAANSYRATVLNAFREAEDQLSDERRLVVQAQQATQAATSALAAQSLSLQLYQQGAAGYLTVIIRESAALSASLTQTQTAAARLEASVNLVRALGSGWSESDIPKKTQNNAVR